VAACTDTYLYDERRQEQLPRDRTITLEGSLCTPSPAAVVRPIKIVIAMDASQSMKVTDPDGTRAQAVVDLLESLPQEPEVSFVVMLFAGSTTAWLSKASTQVFERVVDYSATDRLFLESRILAFTAPAANANRDATDFIKPLDDIFALLNRDIAETRLMLNNGTSARYSVIFLSDGQPTNPEDDELLCGDAVRRIRQLKDLADDVRLNTVNVFLPSQPVDSTACVFDAGITIPVGGSTCQLPQLPAGTCPLLIINQNAERLRQMAALGGGNFRDFRNDEPINFLNFNFGQVRRAFVLDKVIASNFSAPADSPLDEADTDSDGLTDAQELQLGTSPFLADTDGDGFSDGVEVYARSRGADFTPDQHGLPDGGGLDPGCPPELRGVDTDHDGLTDCDEQIIGTNALKIDSDDDGVPDSVEFKLGTQASSRDLDQDPDNDRLTNGQELALHTNPLVADSDTLSTTAYRVEVQLDGGYTVGLRSDGGLVADGRQCFTFTISNIQLANTLPDSRDAGNPDGGAPLYRRGAGYNDLFVSVSMKSADDPGGHTLMRIYRSSGLGGDFCRSDGGFMTQAPTRFPVGGIKSPHDGLVHLAPEDLYAPEDFSTGCLSVTRPVP
jgi:hypothetical protein